MARIRLTRLLVLALLMLAIPAASFAGIFVSITVAPPPLPVYVQPVCPQEGYMWTPGYWAWGDEGYYWIPGTWVPAPSVGYLWTPGYWGWGDGYYSWNAGYWGPHVGFYGGVNYGFGYGGEGFGGGEWRGREFYYNRAAVNVNNTHITNVYENRTVVVNNTTVNHVSYNGGQGGISSAPTAAERRAAQERHVQPTQAQVQHESAARQNRQLLAKSNHGRPPIAATSKPGDFTSRSAVPARAAGGRVGPATLNASGKTMRGAGNAPVSPRAPSAVARPGTPDTMNRASHNASNAPSTRENNNVRNTPRANPDNHNVSRPPNASVRSWDANRSSHQVAPRPPVNGGSTHSGGDSRFNTAPNVSRSQPQVPQHSNRPQGDSRTQSASPHVQNQPSAPAHNSGPAQHQEKKRKTNERDANS